MSKQPRKTVEIYICDICWRDTISKSRVCARCMLDRRSGRREEDDDSPGDSNRSDSQYHGDNYE